MNRVRSRLLFWIILSVGTVMVTAGYIALQAPGTTVPFGPEVHLSEADKVYIDQISEQTKWLESLAYASLAGLIILEGKRSTGGLSKTTSVGAALLIVSLYAGFLSRDVILIALTKGAPLLYSALGRWPHIAQFWCLIVGLGLLARDFLWPHKRSVSAVAATIILLAFVFPVSLGAQAPEQALTTNGVSGCAADWAQSRFANPLTAEDQTVIADFLSRTAARGKVPPAAAESCDFVYSTMDEVRNASKAMSGKDTLAQTLILTGSLKDQLRANAAAPGTFLATLVNGMEIWQRSTGTISIETTQTGASVKINQQFVGPAPLLYIAKPGNYTVQVIRGGVVLAQQSLTVTANVRSVVTVP